MSGALSHPSLIALVLGVLVAGMTAVRIAAEERLIAQRYPEYCHYARHTKRLVPFIL
jgi:protein-S-isoprenylcysteine O-methyltransferase Ste14